MIAGQGPPKWDRSQSGRESHEQVDHGRCDRLSQLFPCPSRGSSSISQIATDQALVAPSGCKVEANSLLVRWRRHESFVGFEQVQYPSRGYVVAPRAAVHGSIAGNDVVIGVRSCVPFPGDLLRHALRYRSNSRFHSIHSLHSHGFKWFHCSQQRSHAASNLHCARATAYGLGLSQALSVPWFPTWWVVGIRGRWLCSAQ